MFLGVKYHTVWIVLMMLMMLMVFLPLLHLYLINRKAYKIYAEKQRKCQHEKFIFVKTEYHFTNELHKVKTNFYECCGCGFIKKDEGFVNED